MRIAADAGSADMQTAANAAATGRRKRMAKTPPDLERRGRELTTTGGGIKAFAAACRTPPPPARRAPRGPPRRPGQNRPPAANPAAAARSPPPTMAPSPAAFPSAVSAKYSSESAGKARMHTCLDQYNANKAAGGNGGLNWIQKGGGYYSECNKRLKG